MKRAARIFCFGVLLLAILASAAMAEESSPVLTLPASLQQVEDYAFLNNTAIQQVVIPEGTTQIGQHAFEGCTGLKRVSIPAAVQKIGQGAFEGCTQLVIACEPFSYAYQYAVENGLKYELEPTPQERFTVARTSGRYGKITAYSGSDTVVVIPEKIGDYIIEEIGSSVFANNSQLTGVVLPAQMATIGSSAFSGCKNLVNVAINNKLETIGYSAFYGCTRLMSIHIPDSVTTIKADAFKKCSKLAECNYPVGWTSAGINGSYYNEIFVGTLLKTLEIPEGIKAIPANAFSGCDNFEYFDLPESLTQIQDNTFYGCTGLSEMVIPAKVEMIGSSAFYGCSGLTSVTLNDGLKTISYSAFYGCTKLGKTYVPSSVTSIIGSNAFGNCPNLKIFCEYGSTALQYAIDKNIPYYYLSLTDYWMPSGTLYQGDNLPLRGVVRCSENLDFVTVNVYEADGTTLLKTGTVENPGTGTVDLRASLNYTLNLSTLPFGTYVYEVKASSPEDAETFGRSTFTIAPPPARISLSSDAVYPTGMVAAGGSVTTAGYVLCNYNMSSIRAEIWKAAD